MNKKVSTKSNAVFLAAILIAGTIALSSSFMTGAQAVPDFKNKFHKSYGKDGFIKCNQWNININGVEFNIGDLSVLEGLLGPEVAEASEIEANSFGNNGGNHGPSGSDDGVAVICISNNDNRGAGGGGGGEEPPTCETCFTDNLSQEELNDLLELLSPTPLRDLEGLCDVISNPSATNQDKLDLIIGLFNTAGINDQDTIVDVLECLRDLGIITGPIPTP